MAKRILSVIGLLALLLGGPVTSAFELERTRTEPAKAPQREKAKLDPCDPAAAKPPKMKPSKIRVEHGKAAPKKSGVVDILVVDEDNKGLSGFTVRVDGTEYDEKTPLPFGIVLEEGEHAIEVEHKDVGKGCKSVTMKSGAVVKVGFQFFRLREEVTQLKTTAFERTSYGAIVVVLDNLGDETEIFVDPKSQVPNDGDFDGRVTRGTGSLKISNLAVGTTYLVEVKKKEDSKIEPWACGEQGCKIVVPLKTCETVTVAVRRSKDNKGTVTLKEEKGSPLSSTDSCEGQQKKRSAAKK